jgi:hypothetical protein
MDYAIENFLFRATLNCGNSLNSEDVYICCLHEEQMTHKLQNRIVGVKQFRSVYYIPPDGFDFTMMLIRIIYSF